MFHILCIDHLVLRVTSLPVMQAFYCGVLGCTVEREAPGIEGRNLDHFCLAIDSFDAVQIQQHLQAHGVVLTTECPPKADVPDFGVQVHVCVHRLCPS